MVARLGPDYHAPATSAPANWSEPLAGGATTRNAEVANWWITFDDPVLNVADRPGRQVEPGPCALRKLVCASAGLAQRLSESNLWPTVDASASYQRQRESEHQPLRGSLPLPAGVPFENNVYQAGFDASWEIDLFGGQRRALEAANADVAVSLADRNDVLVSLLAEVARNYVEIRGLQRRLAIAADNIKSQEDTVDLTRARFRNGLTSDLDVSQAAALLANMQSQVPMLEVALEQGMHQLATLIGQEPGALIAELSRQSPIPLIPLDVPVGLPADLLRRRPDVRRAEKLLASATAMIGVQKAELFPKLSLTGDLGLLSVSTGDFLSAGSRYFSVGPTLQWRIFDAGRIRANIRVENARQEEALAAYEKTVLVALREVEDALSAYAKEQVRYQHLQQEVEQDRQSVELSQAQYSQGQINFLNVLDAERSLNLAQDLQVQSQQAITQSLIALYKALGGGWEPTASPGILRRAPPPPQPNGKSGATHEFHRSELSGIVRPRFAKNIPEKDRGNRPSSGRGFLARRFGRADGTRRSRRARKDHADPIGLRIDDCRRGHIESAGHRCRRSSTAGPVAAGVHAAEIRVVRRP